MAIQKRFNRKKDLLKVPVLIEESGTTSKYFQIYDVPNELPMGKSSFLVGGSDLLVGNVKLQIEIIDSHGGVIYSQPAFGYSEGVSKRIAIEVYDDTPAGRAQLVVLGEIDPSKVDFPISPEFVGVYNVRYTRDVSVNLTIPNTLPIRFYRTPKATVTALSKGFIELDVAPLDTITLSGVGKPKSHVGAEAPVTNTDGTISYPGIDARTKNIRAVIEQNKSSAKTGGGGGFLPLPPSQQNPPGDYTLTLSSDNKADMGMIGQDILITNPSVDYSETPWLESNESYKYIVPSQFSSSVLDVPDQNTLTLLDSFYVTKVDQEPPIKIPVALDTTSISADRQSEPTGSESTFNFYDVADMFLTDLRNFSGDINKVKIYTRSDGAQNPSQWTFIKEIFLESKEELFDTGSLLRSGNMGYFLTQEKIDDYWQGYSGEFATTSGGTIRLLRDSSELMNAMDISGSNRSYNNDLMIQSKKPISLKKNVNYDISLKVYGDAKPKLKSEGDERYEGKLQIFMSGSTIPSNTDLSNNFGRLLGSIGLPSNQSNNEGSFNFDLVEAGFLSRSETNGYLQIRMPSGRWKLAEISVRPSTSTNFSPEIFKAYAELPVAQNRPDFYQFLIEYYDVNNNKADAVTLSERILFEGANTTIQGDNNLLSGSLFIGNTLLSGIEAGGASSAFIRSMGYFGFDKAESLASGGFMFWSGSVIPDHETYDGIGLELHNDETKNSGNDSYLQFRTRDENGNSLFRVKTDEFFFGNEGQHISGSGGNIQISSSKFFLGSDTQYISGSDGNIEISSSNFHLTADGDVTMSGTITADAGYIAGWQIVGNTLSGSNITLDADGAGLYKSDSPPDAYPTTGYYIDFTPGTNYYIRMGPHFAVSSSGILIASGAQIEGQLTASSGLIANWNIGDNAIYKYTTANTWTGLSSTGDTRFFAGATTLTASGSAPFNVKESGEITASSGLIGGWSLSSNKLVSPNSRMTMSANPGNERITVRNTSNDEMVRIGEISDAAGDMYGIKIYDGSGVYDDDTKQGQVVLLGDQGNMIGGWEITDTQIRSIPDAGFGGNYYEGESGLIIHSSGRLESADFASNLKGWRIDSLGNGTAEFENAKIRGTLSTAVFEKESVNVVGGQLMVANSSALGALKSGSIIIAGAETASASDVTMSFDNVSGFAPGEIIKTKVVGSTGFSVEYLQVTGSLRFSHPSSSVSASLAGYDMGAIDPDGLAGEIYVGRAYGGATAISSSISTITEPITVSAASGSTERIYVAASASFSDQQILKIDDERMKIIRADGLNAPSGSGIANTMIVLRDYNDTENEAHADNSSVWVIDSDKEFLAGLVSTAQPYNAGQVFVSTGKYDESGRGTGYILMNANPNDMSTPYIDIVERTGSGVYDLSLKTRIGDLSGLSSAYLYGDDEPGFGIYTENGFFSGAITAQTGSFAGIVHIATVQGGLETGEKISMGRNVSGTNDGIRINNNNYWYTTGAWKVGGATNYISLDNATDGNITIASQTFNLDATDLDISSTSKYIKIGHDAGNGSIVLQGGSTSYIEIGASNKLTLKSDGTDQFMVMGSKSSFAEFDQSTAGIILGMDATVPKFEMVGTGGTPNYFSFDGTSIDMRGSITITAGPLSNPDELASKTNLAGATVSASNAQDAATSAGQAAAANTEVSASTDATTKADAAEAAASASAASDIFTSNAGAIYKPVTPTDSGLYLGATHLGFYNGSDWKAYMASSGNFYLAGSSGTQGLTWDYAANTLSIDGALTARTGYIGNGTSGFTITANDFYNGKTGLSNTTAGVYVGTDGIALGSAGVTPQFSVTSGGVLVASSATITGTITAADGDIGGWEIESGYIHKDGTRLNAGSNNGYLGIGVTAYDANDGIWLGEVSSGVYKFSIKNSDGSKYLRYNDSALEIAAGNFTLDASGNITATSVDLTGEINATSGTFTGNVNVDGTLTAGTAKFGESVESSNDGIWLNANNYWYDTGTIKAQDGTIGGWTLGSGALTGGIVSLNAAGSIVVGSASGKRVDLSSSTMKFYNSSNTEVLELQNAMSKTITIAQSGKGGGGSTTFTSNGGIEFADAGAIFINGTAAGSFADVFMGPNHFIHQANNQDENYTFSFGNYLDDNYGDNKNVHGAQIFAYQGAPLTGSSAIIEAAHISARANQDILTRLHADSEIIGLTIDLADNLWSHTSTNAKGLNIDMMAKDVATNYGIYIDFTSQETLFGSEDTVGTAYGIYSKGKIASTNNIIAYVSDKRLKEDLKIIDNPIDKIKSLEGITFTWNDKSVNNRRGERDVGLIAQDVQKVLPEAIELFQHDKDEVKNGALGGDLLNIQYQKLTALLIEGIKEQQEQIEFLQERVTTLELGSNPK